MSDPVIGAPPAGPRVGRDGTPQALAFEWGALDGLTPGTGRTQRQVTPPPPGRVNCFTSGTWIATPIGEIAIDTLRPGDRVLTRDNGPQEVRWVGRKHLEGPPLRLDSRLQPVMIRAGALGAGLPERDLSVSPGHRVLLLGDHPVLDMREAEVFVSARHLVGTRGIRQAAVDRVSYIHFMCDRHEVVMSNGAWTESFQPSDGALEGVAEQAREEILDLFPGLGTALDRAGFGTARPTLDARAFNAPDR